LVGELGAMLYQASLFGSPALRRLVERTGKGLTARVVTRVCCESRNIIGCCDLVHNHMNEEQRCFVNDQGYMLCNYIVRNGEAVYTKSGKWWRWFVGIPRWVKKQETASVLTDTVSLKT
jgi:hypothetical protein